ncbi:hypothetical protein ACIGPN_19430 [Streptomyces afghaniensis]|uniref:hypothetical protein n=1 Tax=Streptomyces afghaniensis TaxID=66865 RepID=UPI0037CF46D9
MGRHGDNRSKNPGVPAVEASSGANAAGRDIVNSVALHIDSAVIIFPEAYPHLTDLPKQAQRADDRAATQVLYGQELTHLEAEAKQLRVRLLLARDELTACRPVTQALTAAREEAAGFATRLTAVEAELSEARTRAEAAEADRDRLADQAAGQRHQLKHAVAYSREQQSALAVQRERVKTLQVELQVFQHQVQPLLHQPSDADHQQGNPAEIVLASLTAPGEVAGAHAPADALAVVQASVPVPDWQPAPVRRWRPERELAYPEPWNMDEPLSAPQRERLDMLRKSWREFTKDLKTTRSRLGVPFHVRAARRTINWLHRSTGDSRWLLLGESIEALQHFDIGYGPTGEATPDAAVPKPPEYELTMATVIAYRCSVDQLRTDLRKLTGLHFDRHR